MTTTELQDRLGVAISDLIREDGYDAAVDIIAGVFRNLANDQDRPFTIKIRDVTFALKFLPGDDVYVIDIGCNGVVKGVVISVNGIEYDVAYWWNGVQQSARLYEEQIQARDTGGR